MRRLIGVGLATLGLVSASLVASSPAPAAGTRYAIGVATCAPAASGQARCLAMRRKAVPSGTTGARPYAASSSSLSLGPNGGYTPEDIASAYGADPASASGAGKTVAIVDAFNDPSIAADLGLFDSQYGLPAETASSFSVVGQTGTSVLPGHNDASGWSGEEALDVETVRGLCHLCNIVLVEANTASDADLAAAASAAASLHPTVISNSYGEGETTSIPSSAYSFPGIVVVASSGDDGWYDQDLLDSVNSPELPAVAPGVVSVGGTTLNLGRDGSRVSETVWNDDGPYLNDALQIGSPQGATGGGCSTKFAAPAWQLHVIGYASTGCGSARNSADVSVDGDYITGLDIYSSFDCGPQCEPTGWATVGGTSLSSAIVAALWALAGGSHGLDFPAASLYATRHGAPAFHDVTEGGAGFCDAYGECEAQSPSPNTFGDGMVDCAWDASGNSVTATGQCDARPGYDGPSGVGTPDGLAGFIPVAPEAVVKVPAKLMAKRAAHFSASGSTDPYPGERLTSYSWSWGDGSTGSTGPRPTHSYAKAGKYRVRLTVTDSLGLTGHSAVRLRVR